MPTNPATLIDALIEDLQRAQHRRLVAFRAYLERAGLEPGQVYTLMSTSYLADLPDAYLAERLAAYPAPPDQPVDSSHARLVALHDALGALDEAIACIRVGEVEDSHLRALLRLRGAIHDAQLHQQAPNMEAVAATDIEDATPLSTHGHFSADEGRPR